MYFSGYGGGLAINLKLFLHRVNFFEVRVLVFAARTIFARFVKLLQSPMSTSTLKKMHHKQNNNTMHMQPGNKDYLLIWRRRNGNFCTCTFSIFLVYFELSYLRELINGGCCCYIPFVLASSSLQSYVS